MFKMINNRCGNVWDDQLSIIHPKLVNTEA